MGPIAALKLAAFIVGLLVEYGPTLVKLGRKIYGRVEEKYGDHTKEPDPKKRAKKKQGAFQDLLGEEQDAWRKVMGYTPAKREIDGFRENIWARENWRKKTMREKLAKKAPGRK